MMVVIMMMAMMSIPTLFSRSNSTISRFSLSMPMSRAVLMMMMSTVNSQQSHLPRGSTQSMLMEFPCSSNILLRERSSYLTNPHILIIIDPIHTRWATLPPGAGDIAPLHGEEELLLREGEWLRSSHRVGGPVAKALLKVKFFK